MNRFLTALAAAAVLAALSTSGNAQQPQFRACTGNAKVIVDWKRDKDGLPYLTLDREIIEKRCGTASTTFQLENMPGIAGSDAEITELLEAYKVLKRFKIQPADIDGAYKYLETLNKKSEVAVRDKVK